MVPQLIYGSDSEISKFNVDDGDSLFAYTFMKGNLIEKTAILNTSN